MQPGQHFARLAHQRRKVPAYRDRLTGRLAVSVPAVRASLSALRIAIDPPAARALPGEVARCGYWMYSCAPRFLDVHACAAHRPCTFSANSTQGGGSRLTSSCLGSEREQSPEPMPKNTADRRPTWHTFGTPEMFRGALGGGGRRVPFPIVGPRAVSARARGILAARIGPRHVWVPIPVRPRGFEVLQPRPLSPSRGPP